MKIGVQAGMIFFVLQLLTACRIYPKVESYQDQKLEQAEMRPYVFQNGSIQIHYWEGGNLEGEPLVFLHGFGGDAAWTWARNFPDFSEKYHIIAPDLLWFGESEIKLDNSAVAQTEYDSAPSLQIQVDAIQLLLEQKKIDSTNIIGLSYGGFVGMELSKIFPVDSLILVGVGGWQFSEQEVAALTDRFAVEHLEEIFVPETKEGTRILIDICFHAPVYLVPRQFSDDLYGTVFGKYPEQQAELLRELIRNQYYYRENEASYQAAQTLIILGETDPLFTVEQAKELSEILKGELLVYGNADHTPSFEYRRKFGNDVNQFLDKREGTASAVKGNKNE